MISDTTSAGSEEAEVYCSHENIESLLTVTKRSGREKPHKALRAGTNAATKQYINELTKALNSAV